jgi:hypothetical protein
MDTGEGGGGEITPGQSMGVPAPCQGTGAAMGPSRAAAIYIYKCVCAFIYNLKLHVSTIIRANFIIYHLRYAKMNEYHDMQMILKHTHTHYMHDTETGLGHYPIPPPALSPPAG